MRTALVFAAYAAFVVAQELDVDAIAAADPVPTPDIPIVYSYSADYATPPATVTSDVVSYDPTAAAASVSAEVAAATIDASADTSGATTSASVEADAAVNTEVASPDPTAAVEKRGLSGSCATLFAAGRTYMSDSGVQYTVQCGTDYAGADLASASVSKFSDCYAKCDAYKGCVSFAYLPGTCYLKRLGGIAKANSGVQAGALVNMPTTAAPNVCGAQPSGLSHSTSPDTDTAFLADTYYSNTASNAVTPAGYTNAFTNFQASNNALGYLGYLLMSSYDTVGCSQSCDAIVGCSAFNLYFERDPSVEPNDSSCSNPASYTRVKCVFWGGPVTTANALNNGQWSSQFHVVMAGSNGYVNHSINTPTGYTAPSYLGSSIISAPAVDCAGNSPALASYVWTAGPFDANLCATACSIFNGTKQSCQFFNTYVVYADGKSAGQYCQLYSQTFDSSVATNKGSTIVGVSYTYGYSFSSSNATNAGGPIIPCNVAAASSAIASASLQLYCSTILGYFPSTATVTATSFITAVTSLTVTLSATVTTTITAKNLRRAMTTPSALTSYAASIISSACSLQATPVTSTQTITASTQTVTAATSTATSLTTLTTTVVTTAPAPSPTSVIVNGDFETKSLTPWTATNPLNGAGGVFTVAGISQDGKHGSYASQIGMLNPNPSVYGGFTATLQQTVAWSVGKTYTLSFDYRCMTASSKAWLQPKISFKSIWNDDSGRIGNTVTCYASVGTWQTVTYSMTVTSTMQLYAMPGVMVSQSGYDQAIFQFDNFSFISN